MNLATSAADLTFFDQGIAVAVMVFCGSAAIVLGRRWLKAMDTFERRDQLHLTQIEQAGRDLGEQRDRCHREQMATITQRIERDEQTAAVLTQLSESIRVIREKLER